jgi:4-amino-4-deoxy-L-arabinose transferase-like glycosyltransferase
MNDVPVEGSDMRSDKRHKSRRRHRLSFGAALAAVVVLGAVARIAYVYAYAPDSFGKLFPDSVWYYQEARNIRHGVGIVDLGRQFAGLNGHAFAQGLRPTAYWPPGYPALLVVVQSVFGEGLRASQLAGVASGAATIVLTGLLGRAIGGLRIGLLAALLIAINPLIIAIDGSLMSETLYVPLVLLALLLAQRARDHPSPGAWVALGVTIGAATLVRQDALLLIIAALVPAAILTHANPRRVIRDIAIGLGATTLVLAPWMIRNEIRVGTPTLSSVSASMAIGATNCRATYYGAHIGWWSYDCVHPELGFRMSETAYSNKILGDGLSYAVGHSSRWPNVLAARLRRMWGFWSPGAQAHLEAAESRNFGWQQLAWAVSIVILGGGLAGIVLLGKRGAPITLLVAPLAMTTVIAIASYGNSRFRGPAECALAIGTAALLTTLWERKARSTPAGKGANRRVRGVS